MKKTTLTFLTLAALCGLAYAGPEAMSSKEVAPAPIVAPPPCFEGFYFGVQGGGLLDVGRTEVYAEGIQFTPGGPGPGPDFARNRADEAQFGGFGGLHAGYNHQSGMWVMGLEIDLNGAFLDLDTGHAISRRGGEGTDEEDEEDGPGTGFGGSSHLGVRAHGDTDLRAFGTFRPRLGIVLGGRFLFFGTGGVVGTWTDSSVTEDIRYRFPSEQETHFVHIHKDRERDIDGGWTVGGGMDYCLSEHFLLTFTYLYCDAGDRVPTETHRFVDSGGPNENSIHSVFAKSGVTGEIQFHVFQLGLSYKF